MLEEWEPWEDNLDHSRCQVLHLVVRQVELLEQEQLRPQEQVPPLGQELEPPELLAPQVQVSSNQTPSPAWAVLVEWE